MKFKILVISILASIVAIFIGRNILSNSEISCLNKDKKNAQEVLDLYVDEWDDTSELAKNSSRMNLHSIIQDLQTIKRRVKSEEWGECARPTVTMLEQSMESKIDGLILFLNPNNDSHTVTQSINSSQDYRYKFIERYSDMRLKRSKKDWEIFLVEKKIVPFLNTIDYKQEFEYESKGKYEESFNKLITPKDNMEEFNKEIFQHYDIAMSANEDKLIVLLLAKHKFYKSYVQFITRSKVQGVHINNFIICQTEEASKSINKPVFKDSPVCPKETLELHKSWDSY